MDHSLVGSVMKSYETSATVGGQGQVHVAGVPFEPGTEVAITISPMQPATEAAMLPDGAAQAMARDTMRELFRTIKGFRNSPRIPREELYDRARLP